MGLNKKNFFWSMMAYLMFFVILGVCMVVAGYWDFWSEEMAMLMGAGFLVSAAINMGKTSNQNKNE